VADRSYRACVECRDVTTVLLVRHGRTTANDAGVLAGWTEGVSLDQTGEAQVRALAERLAPVPLAAVVTSPLQRCQETTALLLDGREVPVHPDDRLGEVRYGEWSGQELKKLAKDPLWKVVQSHPSAMTFPGEDGESLRAMSSRAVDAVRDWTARLGEDAVYAVVSHGDVVKAILADALGMHLDQFQRLVVDPGSVSIVTYTPLRPFVLRVNDVGGDLSFLAPRKRPRRRRKAPSSDASLGGGLGAADSA
jgi:probable phosphomutase (TIGR03848 family)